MCLLDVSEMEMFIIVVIWLVDVFISYVYVIMYNFDVFLLIIILLDYIFFL